MSYKPAAAMKKKTSKYGSCTNTYTLMVVCVNYKLVIQTMSVGAHYKASQKSVTKKFCRKLVIK